MIKIIKNKKHIKNKINNLHLNNANVFFKKKQ